MHYWAAALKLGVVTTCVTYTIQYVFMVLVDHNMHDMGQLYT